MLTDDQRKALDSLSSAQHGEDTLDLSDTVIDLGDYGAAQETISMSGCDDVITIMSSDMSTSSISTITLPSYSSPTYTTGISITGATGAVGSSSWNNTTTSYTLGSISGLNNTSKVNIGNDGIDVRDGADIKIGDRSLKEFMTKMEQRLSILVPDPEKLEKFEALKKAYEHYKTMEALCFPEPDEEESE